MITTAPVQYAMPDEALHFTPPECIICHERRWSYTVLTTDSDYDGAVICGKCQHNYFDPVITLAIAKEKAKEPKDG
jgi:hypothetical protein